MSPGSTPPEPLSPAEGYRLWAPSYDAETAVSHLDDALVRALSPDPIGRPLLDAGTGTGRRLRTGPGAGAAPPVGVDRVPEMLAAGTRGEPEDAPEPLLAAADARALPFADGRFALIWCRLVLGHLAELGGAYGELARVAEPGAAVVVTTYHPGALAVLGPRSFRDAGGRVHTVEHNPHARDDHVAAAAGAGLDVETDAEARVGPEVLRFYRDAGRIELYERHVGLPVVLGLRFRKVR